MRVDRFALFLSLALSVLLAGHAASAQNTIHVPAGAATIQAGIDMAQNGDTVLVSPGTYNENIDFKGKNITVTSGATSFAAASSVILNAAGDGPVVTFDSGEGAGAVLNGLTVQGGKDDVATCTYGGGIYVSAASPAITNNVITNNVYGILSINGSSLLIQGNDVKGNYGSTGVTGCQEAYGVPADAGITLRSAGSTRIISNTIEENVAPTIPNSSNSYTDGAGISVSSGSDLLVENNIIRNNKADTHPAFMGVISGSAGTFSFIQNLIYNNTDTAPDNDTQVFIGNDILQPLPTLIEVNNTIYGPAQELGQVSNSSVIENNIFENLLTGPGTQWALWCASAQMASSTATIANNAIVAAQSLDTGCNLGTGNITTQPLFRNAANGDFHEQDNSPTIDAGSASAPSLPKADLDGKNRVGCGAVDMGAYEWHLAPPIALSSSNNPAQGGSSITFSAQLTGRCSVEPAGTVTFNDGGSAIGSGTLSEQALATFTTSFLVVGQHAITAQYPGDFNFEPNTSSVLTQTITGDPTSATLTVSPNPATAFQSITFASTVTSPYVTPNGTVIFTANGQNIATATLNSAGSTSVTTSALGAGTYSVVANYQATTLFHASSSAPVQLTVQGIATTTTLTAAPNPVTVTQPVAFTVKVAAAQGGHVPTGTVTLLYGSAVLQTVALDASSSAAISISTLSAGTHTITARYSGDANFNASSATVSETVALAGTTLSLTASHNPSNTGQAVTLTASASSALTGAISTGTVTFKDGNTVLGTAGLGVNGTALFTTSSLSVGTHPLTAVLAAGAVFGGSASAVVNEVVQANDFSLAVSPSQITLPSGGNAGISVALTPIGGFNESVTLSCANLPQYVQCLFPKGGVVSLANGEQTVAVSIQAFGTAGAAKSDRRTAALVILGLPVMGLLGLFRRKEARRFLSVGWVAIVVLGSGLLACCLQGCSSTAIGNRTAPGTYQILLTGSSTDSVALEHSVPVQLTVTAE